MARFVRKPRPHAQRRGHGHEDEHHDEHPDGTEVEVEAGDEFSAAEEEAEVHEPEQTDGDEPSVAEVSQEEESGEETAEEDGSGHDEPAGEAQLTLDDAGQPDADRAPVAEPEREPEPEPEAEAGPEAGEAGPEPADDDGLVGFGPPLDAAPSVEESTELVEATAAAVSSEPAGSDSGDEEPDGEGESEAPVDEETAALTRTIKRRRRRRRPAGAPATGAGDEDAAEPGGGPSAPAETDGAEGEQEAPSRNGEAARQAPRRAAVEDKDERARLQMLIHVEGERVQVSVLEGRTLVEHYVADRSTQSIAGNIYLGKVQNVLPGMEAAFIDIGTPKNAVLYAGDVRYIDEEFDGRQPRIEEVLDVGQSVLVQVVKDPMGSKGARLTTEISLPGRFLVLVPENDSTGISRRLQESERERLRDVLRRIRPDGFGVIVRTAAEFTSEDKLALDMARLEELWKQVYLEATRVNPPCLVYEEPDLVIRTVREIFSGEFRRLIVDDKDVHDKIVGYLGDYEPDLLHRISLYDDEMPLYRRYHVAEQLRQGLARKVWLPSGGSLVFDIAEALTVIDVNTSKNVGKNSLEETVYANNLEAAEEIARQLRLRDIGGIIVIDFIDMENAKNRQSVLRAFKEAVGRDKTKTQVYDISDLGLVEMTRKNVSEGLIHAFSRPCTSCSGRGLLIDDEF